MANSVALVADYLGEPSEFFSLLLDTPIHATLGDGNAVAAGHLHVFAAGTTVPGTSSVNFAAGRTRAANGVVALGADRAVTLLCEVADDEAAPTHVIVDVSGYFE